MRVQKLVGFRLTLNGEEAVAVASVLEKPSQTGWVAAEVWDKLQDAMARHQASGRPIVFELDGAASEELRVRMIRACKSADGTDDSREWTGVLGSVARALFEAIR